MTRKKAAPKSAKAPGQEAESGKHPGGRPSDYDRVNLDQARILAVKGFTDQELADFFQVSRATINTWKKVHPEFLDALKLGKEEADRKVERSLFERATGYSHPDTHISNFQGQITETPTTKVYPPDTTAAIFWLKNRQPEKWRDKTEVQDDRFTALLAHMNRNQGGQNAQETRQPPARPGKLARGFGP